MKRLLSFFLCLFLLIAAVGCHTAKPTANTPSSQTEEFLSSAVSSEPEEESSATEPVSSEAPVSSEKPKGSAATALSAKSKQPASKTESVTSSKAPESIAPAPVTSAVTSHIITPLEVSRWNDSGDNEQESYALLLRSPEELRSWLSELCYLDYLPDQPPVFYPIANDSGKRTHDKLVEVDAIVDRHQAIFDQGHVVLGIYTYYPGMVQEEITSLTVAEDRMTVQIKANELETHDGSNRITTLAVLPAESVDGVKYIKVDASFDTANLYTPTVLPQSSYTTVQECRIGWFESAKNTYAVVSSTEELDDWLNANCLPPGFASMDYIEESLAQCAPYFEQGGHILAMTFVSDRYGGYRRVMRNIERAEDRLVVHYDRYSFGDIGNIEIRAMETQLYLVEINSALAEGIETVETIETTYQTRLK